MIYRNVFGYHLDSGKTTPDSWASRVRKSAMQVLARWLVAILRKSTTIGQKTGRRESKIVLSSAMNLSTVWAMTSEYAKILTSRSFNCEIWSFSGEIVVSFDAESSLETKGLGRVDFDGRLSILFCFLYSKNIPLKVNYKMILPSRHFAAETTEKDFTPLSFLSLLSTSEIWIF